jgi:hypothetical protein
VLPIDIAAEVAPPVIAVMKVSVSGKRFSADAVGNNPDAVLREKYLRFIAAVVTRKRASLA